jgi:hypothetical protein
MGRPGTLARCVVPCSNPGCAKSGMSVIFLIQGSLARPALEIGDLVGCQAPTRSSLNGFLMFFSLPCTPWLSRYADIAVTLSISGKRLIVGLFACETRWTCRTSPVNRAPLL